MQAGSRVTAGAAAPSRSNMLAPTSRKLASSPVVASPALLVLSPASSSCTANGSMQGWNPTRRSPKVVVSAKNRDEEEPDWDKEMSIFKKRMMAPNQLATLREMEAKVNVGKVLYIKDSLAIISGLNPDAPLGTKLSFVTGGTGVLLWHRSDNLVFALVLGGASTISVGTGVECKIKGVLQVVDEVKGPVTRKDYEVFQAPTGDGLFGQVVDYLGRPLDPVTGTPAAVPAAAAASKKAGGSAAAAADSTDAAETQALLMTGTDRTRPLINQQVAIKNREQISEALLTGVKALDVLTPLGRGSSLLVLGPNGCGKTSLALDAVLGQRGAGVRAVYACVNHSGTDLQDVVSRLRALGGLDNTVVVSAPADAPLGQRYAAICLACSIGERVRDEGGHCLVVVDDVKPLPDVWEELIMGLAGLGADLLRQGLIKDEEGRDRPLPPALTPSSSSAAAPASSSSSPSSSSSSSGVAPSTPASSSGAAVGGSTSADSTGSTGGTGSTTGSADEELVEYEGMLVTGAAAQRRGFFSTFFMRAAKLSRANGGGSLTLLPLVPGRCATGVSKRIDMSKYKTLSDDQKARLEAALRAKAALEGALDLGPAPGELPTETVEEFISISDGQVVLQPRPANAPPPASAGAQRYTVNPKLSLTRIGTRAYYKAMEVMAPQVRLDMMQAEDAKQYGGGSKLSAAEATAQRRLEEEAAVMAAALQQEPGSPAPLEEQVVTLFAIQKGFMAGVAPADASDWLRRAMRHVQSLPAGSAALREIATTKLLTASAEKALLNALKAFDIKPSTAAAKATTTTTSSSQPQAQPQPQAQQAQS